MPASWFGAATKKIAHGKPLALVDVPTTDYVASDSDGDGVVTWNDTIKSTIHASDATIQELKKIPIDTKTVKELNDPNNLTSSFSKNLYLASASFEKQGITDPDQQQSAINKLIQNEANKIAVTKFSYKDIIVANTESKDTFKAYGNAIAPILENTITRKSAADDLSAMKEYSETKNASALSTLSINKKSIDASLIKLLAIPVPPSLVSYHILLLERLAAYRDVLDNLSTAATDPIRAVIMIDSFPSKLQLVFNLYPKFSSFFDTNNIVFTSKDAGYVFTKGYTKP